ncbi:MAG: Sulfatase [Chlamydiia bacterium]|nr:Sulfatase [Chlamydiia bacterium]
MSTFKQPYAFHSRYYHAASLLLLLVSSCSTNNQTTPPVNTTKKPNIIVLLTDQERYPTHWPKGWAEKHLSSSMRLKQHGLSFDHAYTAACECTPSRAVLTTSEHFPINKVPLTPPANGGLPSEKELMDIGTLLTEKAGYEVIWKGKWHLTPPLKGGHAWTTKDIKNIQKKYTLSGWNPPDAGTAIQEFIKNPDGTIFDGLSTLGGGYANNDGRFLYGQSKNNPKETEGFGIEGALEYLKKIASTDPDTRKPFCLFISLVNPHDVWVYPKHFEKAGYTKENFIDIAVDLPANYEDDLTTKPSVQLKARDAFNTVSPLKDKEEEKGYVKFYAYLNTLADSHVGAVLDTLEATGLRDDTIIIRTADHGELGLSHGMREKAYTMYEEAIHIPLIVSNPKMYPSPQTTSALYSHLDLLPTLAELAQVPHFSQYGKGVSMVPVLKSEKESVQDSILFTYDDVFFLPSNTPGGHMRAIREGDWSYAVYYSEDGSNFEYELYNLQKDPGQLHNLLYKDPIAEIAVEANRLHAKLKEKIDHSQALPKGFCWPIAPF